MGAVKSTLRGYLENPDNFGENNVDRIREAEILSNNPLHRGTKRRREVEENISACNEEIERLLNTPKKKKLHTTSQYIYDNLFQVKIFMPIINSSNKYSHQPVKNFSTRTNLDQNLEAKYLSM